MWIIAVGEFALSHRSALLVITVLAILAYLPAFQLSFIADDFPQIQMSRTIGEPGGLHDLYEQPIAQWRMTFFVLTYWVDRLAGLDPQIYHGVAVGLHVLCCWLVYALGIWKLVGRKVALIAACFFAVFEGHQEAVMWYSAVMETLLFLFGVGALVCFIQWLRGKGWLYYGLALVSFWTGPVFEGIRVHLCGPDGTAGNRTVVEQTIVRGLRLRAASFAVSWIDPVSGDGGSLGHLDRDRPCLESAVW